MPVTENSVARPVSILYRIVEDKKRKVGVKRSLDGSPEQP